MPVVVSRRRHLVDGRTEEAAEQPHALLLPLIALPSARGPLKKAAGRCEAGRVEVVPDDERPRWAVVFDLDGRLDLLGVSTLVVAADRRASGVMRHVPGQHALRVGTTETDERLAAELATRLMENAIRELGHDEPSALLTLRETVSQPRSPHRPRQVTGMPAGGRTVTTAWGPVTAVHDADPLGYWYVGGDDDQLPWRSRDLLGALWARLAGVARTHREAVRQLRDELAGRDTPAGRRFRCPCCDCWTLTQTGSWEICMVCWWQDDPLQNERPDVTGANVGLTLQQARGNYRATGHAKPEKELDVRRPMPYELPDG